MDEETRAALTGLTSDVSTLKTDVSTLKMEMTVLQLEMRAGFAESRLATAELRDHLGGQLATVIDAIADFRQEYREHRHD